MDLHASDDLTRQPILAQADVAAVILAGGRASRFGFEDKALKPVAGKPLINHVVDKLTPHVAQTLISVNRNLADYEYLHLQLLEDKPGSSNGPLAGVLSAMSWCEKNAREIKYLACAPADVPCFPQQTFQLLISEARLHESHVSWVVHDGQAQPLFSVWPISLVSRVRQALSSGIYGVKVLIQRLPNRVVELHRVKEDEFKNINTSDDLINLESQISFPP